MMQKYDAIYLSPHLDDVALSCGGQIFQRTQAGQRVLIVSVTCADAPLGELPPFAQAHHESWQLGADAVAMRRAEDREACALLGADWLHWDVLDCIYRRHPETGEALYGSDEALFGVLHSAETPLIHHLAAKIRELPPTNMLLVPLGYGYHVDHQLVRKSAEHTLSVPLTYYEDYPYIQWMNERAIFTGRSVRDSASVWKKEVIPLVSTAIQQRIDAIAAFRSQLPHLFNDYATMVSMVHSHIAGTGGETVWSRGHSS